MRGTADPVNSGSNPDLPSTQRGAVHPRCGGEGDVLRFLRDEPESAAAEAAQTREEER